MVDEQYGALPDRKPAPIVTPPHGGGQVTPGLRSLLGRLKTYVVDWKFSFVPAEAVEYEPGIDREASDLTEANIVSSTRKGFPMDAPKGKTFGTPLSEYVPRHVVLLDIDYPAHLVESSTPGHYHLYLDVPHGVKHDDYMELLEVLGRTGVIEKGYADVSIKRGHSDLRLPWVTKQEQKLHAEGPGVNLQGLNEQHPGETASPVTSPTPVDEFPSF